MSGTQGRISTRGFSCRGTVCKQRGGHGKAWQGDEAWQDPGGPGGRHSQPVFCPQPTFPWQLQKG